MSQTGELIRTDELETRRDMPAGAAHRVVPDPAPERELPTQLIDRYVRSVVRRAEVKQYPDGSWFAEIPGFPGVWANDPSQDETLVDLEETLREWVLLKIQDGDRDLRVVDSIDLNVL
jgi:predicted RNase H-like HicB family nuclease